MRFLKRRIHLVAGKGGVGRTTVSAALARAAARMGRRVLVAEFGDPEGGYSAVGRQFGREHFTPQPERLEPGIEGCHIWANSGHEGFLRSILPGGPLIRAALRSKALQRFLTAAPSFHEMGLFYHLSSLIRATDSDGRPRYEAFIVDMPATGHTLALTALPAILLNLMPTGPIATAMRQGQAHIYNPQETAAWVVTLPEQLPVTESLELIEGLRESRVPVGGVLLNRFRPDPFDPEERAALSDYLADHRLHGEMAFRRFGAMQSEAARLKSSVEVPVIALPDIPVGDPVPLLADTLAALMAEEGA